MEIKLIKTIQKFILNGELSNVLYISAKEKTNIEALKTALYNSAIGDFETTNQTIVTNARHLESLAKVLESIEEIIVGLQQNISGDLLAPTIRMSLYHIGEITGEITNEDQLDYIFSKFCIGK